MDEGPKALRMSVIISDLGVGFISDMVISFGISRYTSQHTHTCSGDDLSYWMWGGCSTESYGR